MSTGSLVVYSFLTMSPTASLTTDALLARLSSALPSLHEGRCRAALDYAREVYGDRSFDLMNGVTLLEHAVAVAEQLTEFCPDEDALLSCILQHVLRVPDSSLDRISEEFGRSVRDIVSRVHLLSHLHTSDWRKSIDDMKIMLVSISDDIRILLIVLTIESFFMDHVKDLKSAFRSRLCRQSLQLFAPVAARLGIYAVKYRLERSAFPECYPVDAAHIHEQLQQLHEEDGLFLDRTAQHLQHLLKEQGIASDVMTREKQPYSIFQKMQTKSVTSLSKITDLFAIRVVVGTMADCYQTLGLLHRMATPISHRFKDYISFPKPNGYQSLHTSLIGLPQAPKNAMIEVQIRTSAMHREAEYGIAAHWFYKEQGKDDGVLHSASRMHLSDVLLKQQMIGSASGETEQTALHLVNHIYVLTPRGDIIELPEGGTPLDFAFVLHTDLGLRFKSARVNGGIAAISHTLENGDIVEIQTHKHARPSLHWLEVLVTPSARSKLKTYFFSHHRAQFLQRGRESTNAELKARGLAPLDNDCSILHSFHGKELTMKQREDLLVKVGMGSVRTSSILSHLPLHAVPRKMSLLHQKKTKKSGALLPSLTDLVRVEGQPLTMPYRFAKCCNVDAMKPRPVQMVGLVLRTGVISVHREGCAMAKTANRERRVLMHWNERT